MDQGGIIGLVPETGIVAGTNNGLYVVGINGNLYQTSNHQPAGQLPFTGTAFPVFSADDAYCYAGSSKFRLSDLTLVSSQMPFTVDNRFATLLPGNILIQANRSGSNTIFQRIDLGTDTVLSESNIQHSRVLWAGAIADPGGTYGLVASYSYASGSIDVGELSSDTVLYQKSHDDYTGQIAFTKDGATALVGAYGNSYYGGGGIEFIELTNGSGYYYRQFGGSSVVVGPDDLVYVSTRYVDHFGTGSVTYGSKDKRGIDVLAWKDDGGLEAIKSYSFNYPHSYSTKPTFFIKPGQ
ncbi:hypothetical protein HYZ76_02415 [Candidatus Falkowbacteria bacterium]|nr:hypothetical protein [Candidatus Falkowbacteria bacterium]